MSEMYELIKKTRKYILMLIDVVMVAASYYVVSLICMENFSSEINIFIYTDIIYTGIYAIVFVLFGLYSKLWRYADVIDMFYCIISSFTANFIFFVTMVVLRSDLNMKTYFLATVISTFALILFRICYRTYRRKIDLVNAADSGQNGGVKLINLMIVGAGQACIILLNEISQNKNNQYKVCCIVDDDKTKIGRIINNVPIVSSTNEIQEMVFKYNIEEIIIAIPSIKKDDKKRTLEICSKTNCKLKIMPDLYNLAMKFDESSLLKKIRNVEIEDLLGRAPIKLECPLTSELIKNKIVMVTGGGGSIGSELCRQIAVHQPKSLIILDIYENNAYEIEQELKRCYKGKLDIHVEIASVRDRAKMEYIFENNNIDIVFHAAAHKHVPLMETNPEEAIKNNVFGTYNTAVMADKYNVKKFILISTDKAVNPTNIMGATKRITEMIIQILSKRSKTDFAAVRFGNVLGSNGSVIPLFMKQIKEGGPVTVTHREITRYFMTIPEAVQLVLQAAGMAHGGDVFILDMGEPVKIKNLAENLIKLSGFEPGKDIKIKYTGLRPGEKLYEELLISNDGSHEKTNIDRIFIEKPLYIDENELKKELEEIKIAANNADKEEIFMLMEKIVPTYKRTKNDGGVVV